MYRNRWKNRLTHSKQALDDVLSYGSNNNYYYIKISDKWSLLGTKSSAAKELLGLYYFISIIIQDLCHTSIRAELVRHAVIICSLVECGGGWIKTLAQWQNARLKYFNFPEDKLENCSRRRCCLCFLIILTLACSMWESVVNSSSWRERASEWASEWTSEQWRKQRVLYYISVLFYSLHRSSTAGDDDDDDDTEIAITEHMIAGESESPVLLFAILHFTLLPRPGHYTTVLVRTCAERSSLCSGIEDGRRRGEQRRGGETQPAESGA